MTRLLDTTPPIRLVATLAWTLAWRHAMPATDESLGDATPPPTGACDAQPLVANGKMANASNLLAIHDLARDGLPRGVWVADLVADGFAGLLTIRRSSWRRASVSIRRPTRTAGNPKRSMRPAERGPGVSQPRWVRP